MAIEDTFTIGADLEVSRLGFGAMRITGEGVWGPPADPEVALAVLRRAAELGIGFIPRFPLASGDLARPGGSLATAAEQHDATPGQVALAWLLHRSPVMLPIPGTGSVAHLEENVAARELTLTDEEFAAIDAATAA